MESSANETPLVAIVGQTASGKSALAMELAQRFNGEIIAADSRTIYKHLDIGTAKPTAEDQRLVVHHLLDIVEPSQSFSAAQFKERANRAIAEIAAKGKLPILVGGTGLYIDAVLYDFSFAAPADPAKRAELQALSIAELQQKLTNLGLPLPFNTQNPRHLIRAIETAGQLPEQKELRKNTLVLGMQLDRDVLLHRIEARVGHMLAAGLIDETRKAAEQFGWEAPGLQSTSYKAVRHHLGADAPLDEVKRLFVRNDMQLAKRQKTWFKRNHNIHWISKPEEAVDLVTTLLNK